MCQFTNETFTQPCRLTGKDCVGDEDKCPLISFLEDRTAGLDMADAQNKVAEILARRFYDGWTQPERCKMTWNEYRCASMLNWRDAARGITSLVINTLIDSGRKHGQ